MGGLHWVVLLPPVFSGLLVFGESSSTSVPTGPGEFPPSRSLSDMTSPCLTEEQLATIRTRVDFAEQRLKWGLFAGMNKVLPDESFHPRFLGIAEPLNDEGFENAACRGLQSRESVVHEAIGTHVAADSHITVSGAVPTLGTAQLSNRPSSTLFRRLNKSVLVRSVLPEILLGILGPWKAPSEDPERTQSLLSADECDQYVLTEPMIQLHALRIESGLLGEYRVNLKEMDRFVDFVGGVHKLARTHSVGNSYVEFTYATYIGLLDSRLSHPRSPTAAKPIEEALREMIEFITSSAPSDEHLNPSVDGTARMWCNKVKIHRRTIWAYFNHMAERATDLEKIITLSPTEDCSLEAKELHVFTGELNCDSVGRLAYELGYFLEPPPYRRDRLVAQQALDEETCAVAIGPIYDWDVERFARGFWRPSWDAFLNGMSAGRPSVSLVHCSYVSHPIHGPSRLHLDSAQALHVELANTTRATPSRNSGSDSGAREYVLVPHKSFACFRLMATKLVNRKWRRLISRSSEAESSD